MDIKKLIETSEKARQEKWKSCYNKAYNIILMAAEDGFRKQTITTDHLQIDYRNDSSEILYFIANKLVSCGLKCQVIDNNHINIYW